MILLSVLYGTAMVILKSEILGAEIPVNTCTKKMVFNCTASSFVVSICMKRQKSGKIPEWVVMCAVDCAVQNMRLMATAYNVGAYWSSGPPITMSQEMKDYLKLDEAGKCLGIFTWVCQRHPPELKRALVSQFRTRLPGFLLDVLLQEILTTFCTLKKSEQQQLV
ncbi:hypothetical protein PsorP6_003553 [Peronosclerospora sorghi]|uniref:Uncharacterized protein n=1 Tax=Peronosclerospora sorghi TaxID=230839 RepID=A0ACC0VPW2_9STRA|nr:hypothetical protein PsorP6_003553 [Peronosclerospora sorghi]